MVNASKRAKNRNGKSKNGSRRLDGGDIPAPADHTYHTVSYPLPRVTEVCTVRTLQAATLTASPTVPITTTFQFSLANAGVSIGFWDQYKIEAIRFTISPNNNAVGLVTNSTTSLVPLYNVIDYDDTTALGSDTIARAYSNCVTLAPGESCERTFQPRMALAAYSGAFTSYANVAPQWLDAASSTVQHYGVKTYIPACTVSQTLLQSWNVSIEFFVMFRKSI
jgi:hypothetical protein